MADTQYTPEQRAAIDDRAGDLLVAAAAGSGKTRVLVERLLDQVEAGAELNQFLIITFTRAAAAELKGRILEEISHRLALRPSRHLRRQSALVYSADIDTIHAFCGKIIREFAHTLGVNPQFRMADESESGPMLSEVLEDLLEDRYARLNEFPGFVELVDTLSEGRRDAALIETVLDVHEKLLSHPNPDGWAAERLAELQVSGLSDAKETPWGAYLLRQAEAASNDWLREMRTVREEFRTEEKFNKAYGPSWDELISWLARFTAATKIGWDETHAASTLPALSPRASGYEEFKSVYKRCKEAASKWTASFDLPSLELFEDMTAVRPVIEALIALVLDVDRAYRKAKTRRNVLDFSDLEHLAIRLLLDQESGLPTAVAGELAERYAEVMVDEFQDVSGLQDAIFRALGACGSRRFMVGDVKQSIYRFRLADPTIFLGYYRAFPDYTEAIPGESRKVLLGKNFRSRPGVLHAVNFLFRRIMSVPFGEMDYGDREALYPGKDEPEGAEPAVELDILNKKPLPKDGSDAFEMAEARHVAARIRTLHDQEGYAWGDFAILLRSVSGKGYRFERALEELDIPVAKSSGEGFFYTVEIASILSLLTVILNPLQDVPLIGVLRSPLFGFTPDELAEIRLSDKRVGFFHALEISAVESEKCRAFLANLARWRDAAPDMTVDQFLWYLAHETGALPVFAALPQGETRRQNLLTLLAYARGMAQSGCKSLFDFVTQLEKRLEAGEPPKLAAAHGAGDAVTIMSVHKSKGLEFPIVVLPDLAKRFQLRDLTAQILVHPELGIASVRRDLIRKIRYPTLAQLAIRQKLRQEALAEELRILYVAMTRAKHRLLMTVALDNAEKTMSDLALMASEAVSPYVLAEQSSAAPWILLPTLSVPEPPWTVRVVECGVGSADLDEPIPPAPARGDQQDAASAEEISPADEPGERSSPLQWEYLHPEAVDLPSKLTATELKGRDRDLEADTEAAPHQQAKRPPMFRRPKFIEANQPLTGAERGTATHLVMQYIDFTRCTSRYGVETEIARLQREGRITDQAAGAVDAEQIWTFFESPLGQRVLSAQNLRREFKFSLLVHAGEFLGAGGAEDILLQGVVDCYLEEPDGLVLLDFKTDYIPPGGLLAKAEEYQPQMVAYAYALEQITGHPVKEALLYFFGPGKPVEVAVSAQM
ncbi:MAG: UvrD-helicase domain-containing protein [Oscillospiraceae bacterium]|nr:UvrD-helicase domain-containing protein [Oscillospiraceae bacterium]